MSTFLKNLFENKKNIRLNIFTAFFSIIGIIFIRTFLENFSSPFVLGGFFPPYTLFVHYVYFYFSILFSIIILLYLFTETSLNDLFVLAIKLFPIVWLPPIFDMAITKGKGWQMAYIFADPTTLLKDFFTFFGELKWAGSTPGMRIEIFAILLFTYLFILHKTSSKIKAALGMLCNYIILFIHLAFPSFLMIFYKDTYSNTFFFLDKIYTGSFFESQQSFSVISENQTYLAILEQSFDIFMSRIFWIIVFVQLFILLFIYSKKIFIAWIKNSRLERVIYYAVIAILGMVIYSQTATKTFSSNFTDILAILIFFLLIATNFWLAVIVNDFVDVDIDKISNKTRPLITKAITDKELIAIASILAILTLAGILVLNYITLLMLLFFQFTYFIYSSYPLHLKQNFFTASSVLGLNALLIAMGGFFLISADQNLKAFPLAFIWIIFIGFFLISNIKDIKDYSGDKLGNIYTLPVLFGEKFGKLIISISCSIFLIVFTLILKNYRLLSISILASFFLIYFINKKHYQEYKIFLLFFVYVLLIFFLYTS